MESGNAIKVIHNLLLYTGNNL